jgi:hypothetical protein
MTPTRHLPSKLRCFACDASAHGPLDLADISIVVAATLVPWARGWGSLTVGLLNLPAPSGQWLFLHEAEDERDERSARSIISTWLEPGPVNSS